MSVARHPWTAAALAAAIVAGCSAIDPQIETTATTPVKIVAVGSIEGAKPEWQHAARDFRRALIAALEKSKAYDQVVFPSPKPLPPSTVEISGRFVRLDSGSDAARLIGFGFGSPSAHGWFELRDRDGRLLAAFEETSRTYPGAVPSDMDEVMRDLADETADALIRWSRGKGLTKGLASALLP